MIRLLIADDEKWICSLIESMIDFPQLGLELVGFAYDGAEAIELIRKTKPDIVITDIKMPCADGLQVIKAARDEKLDTRFIILSGHSTFEYAKTAVRYHVEDYLLKPISAPQLMEALEKLCADINDRSRSRIELDALKSDLEATAERMRAHLISNVMYSPFLLEGKDMSSLGAEYNYHFVSGNFQMLLLHVLPLENDLNIAQTLRRLDQILRSRLSVKCSEYESLIDQHRIAILINFDSSLVSIMPEIIEYSFKSTVCSDQISQLMQCTLYLGVPVAEPSALGDSYRSAEHIQNLGILDGLGACYCASSVEEDGADDVPAALTEEQRSRLAEALTGGVQSDLLCFGDSLLNHWGARLRRRPWELEGLLASVFAAVADYCGKTGITVSCFDAKRDDFFFSFPSCRNGGALCRLLSETLLAFSGEIRAALYGSRSLPVTRAREYIREHYAEKLSAELLAELVYLSPNYFSALFKKETGKNFSDYLADVRVERAKELLADPKYTIAQAGEAVGYADPRYFSKLFKKVVGIKPQDYRKICALSRGIGETANQ